MARASSAIPADAVSVSMTRTLPPVASAAVLALCHVPESLRGMWSE